MAGTSSGKAGKNRMKKSMPLWFRAALVLALVPAMAACSIEHPTYMTENKMQLRDGVRDMTVSVHNFDRAEAAEIAAHYARYGHGPVEVAVTYNPRAQNYKAADAKNDAQRIAALLSDEGVNELATELLPIKDGSSYLMVRYNTLTAHAPPGCGDMNLIRDEGVISSYEDYELGCTTESILARQISRPADLMGRAGTAPSDGRRAANIVHRYSTGESRPSLATFAVSQ